MAKLLAFSVLDQDEGTGGIVFASTRNHARKIGSVEYADGEEEFLNLSRARWADKYVSIGKVPKLAMIENGWHFECGGCGCRIDADADDSDPADPVEVGDAVYCSQKCRESFLKEEGERRVVESGALERLMSRVLSKFPHVTVHQTHSYARKVDGAYVPHQVMVKFDFPGCRYAGAQFRIDGNQEPKCTVANGDFSAWKAWNDAGCPARMPELV